MLYHENTPIDVMAHDAGLEAFTGPVSGGVTKTILDRFVAIYDHLATEAFSGKLLNGLYPGPTAMGKFSLQELNSHQQAFKKKADKLGYVNITGAPVPSIDGLKAPLIEYSTALILYSDFGNRVEKSLHELYKLLTQLYNSDESLSSITTVGKLTAIDTHVKYRAKYNADMAKMIGATSANTEVPYGNLVRSNKEMYQVFDHRNAFKKAVNEETKDRIENKVRNISSLMDGFAERITAVDTDANGRVVNALSNTLYEAGQMVRDYGTYLHRINALVGAVDGVVEQVNGYTPEHIRSAVDEALAAQEAGNRNGSRPLAGLNSDFLGDTRQWFDGQMEEYGHGGSWKGPTDANGNAIVTQDDSGDHEYRGDFHSDDIVERFNIDVAAAEKLAGIHDRLIEQGGISQSDVVEIEAAAPGLLSDVLQHYTISPRVSKNGYEAGLNAMSGKQKAGMFGLGLAFLAAIVAIIAKVIQMVSKKGGDVKDTSSKSGEIAVLAEKVSKAGKEEYKVSIKGDGADKIIKGMESAWVAMHGTPLNVNEWVLNPVPIHTHSSEKANKVKAMYYVTGENDSIIKVFDQLDTRFDLLEKHLATLGELAESTEKMYTWYSNKKSRGDTSIKDFDPKVQSYYNDFITAYPESPDGAVAKKRIEFASKLDYKFMNKEKCDNLLTTSANRQAKILGEFNKLNDIVKKLQAAFTAANAKPVDLANLTKSLGSEEKAKAALKEAKAYFDWYLKDIGKMLTAYAQIVTRAKAGDEQYKSFINAAYSFLDGQNRLLAGMKKKTGNKPPPAPPGDQK